jgi:predicted permease
MSREFWRKKISQVGSLLRRRRKETEMIEEMRYHMEELTRANVEGGMTPEEARYAAQRRFGGMAQVEERCRDEHGFIWIGQVANDIRFTLRSLYRSKGFALTVIGTLILGIGLSTAVFNLTAASLLFDLPYPNPGKLYKIGFSDPQDPAEYWCPRFEFQAYKQQTNAFSEYAAVRPRVVNATIHGEPVDSWVLELTDGSLGTLGIKPALGRGFLPGEYRAGQNDVVIISDICWRKNFNAAPDVLGRQVTIDQRACTVVGVLAPDQKFPQLFDGNLYRPADLNAEPDNVFMMLSAIGRLKDGVTKQQAVAAMTATKWPPIPQWATDYLSHQKPILDRLTEVEKPENLWVILAAGAFLYAISCLNVMNLVLIRLLGRRRELSIRFAIGGSRFQVIRLLALESLLLTGAAGVMVALLAKWVFPPLFSALNGSDAAYFHNYWDWTTMSCVLGLSIVACLGAVIVPAFRLLTTDVNSGLKDGGPTIGESRGAARVRNSLVVAQAAFAVVLLIGTGLMVSSFERLHHLDLGFDPVGKVKVQVDAPESFPLKPEARVQLFERLRERMKEIPGVRDASFGQDSAFIGFFAGTAELLLDDGSSVPVAGNFVSPDYLKTAGLVLKKGRWLSGIKGDVEAVISESMAKKRFGNRDPVGLSFKIRVSGDLPYHVVGVVGDVREVVRAPAGIRYYVPYWMFPPNINTLLLRMDSDPKTEFAAVVKKAVFGVEPRLVVQGVSSINEIVGSTMATERYAYIILRGLAAVALVLTVVGLFAVISYSVDSRMNEFGVRMALGATAANLRALVIRRGLGAASMGLVVGIAGAFALTRFMESLLFETKPYDPRVYLGVAASLAFASLLACWLPARRAAQVDLVRLLKSG